MVEFFASRTVFLSVGSLHITWYGMMYVAAFWGAWYLLPKLGNMRGVVLSREVWTKIVAFGALGALVGGRIGYAIFYEPSFFLVSPLQILNIWNGGMSSHGGFIGAALGVWWASGRERRLSLAVADIATIPAAIGLALGRIGNSINQEFGVYPYYEAIGDAAIAVACYLILRARGAYVGKVFAIFLILYSILRFSLEFIRPQEWPLFYGLSRGQILTIPLLIAGMLLLMRAYKPIIQKPL